MRLKLTRENPFFHRRAEEEKDSGDGKHAEAADLALPGAGAGAGAGNAFTEVGTTTPAEDFRALIRDGSPLVAGKISGRVKYSEWQLSRLQVPSFFLSLVPGSSCPAAGAGDPEAAPRLLRAPAVRQGLRLPGGLPGGLPGVRQPRPIQ